MRVFYDRDADTGLIKSKKVHRWLRQPGPRPRDQHERVRRDRGCLGPASGFG